MNNAIAGTMRIKDHWRDRGFRLHLNGRYAQRVFIAHLLNEQIGDAKAENRNLWNSALTATAFIRESEGEINLAPHKHDLLGSWHHYEITLSASEIRYWNLEARMRARGLPTNPDYTGSFAAFIGDFCNERNRRYA